MKTLIFLILFFGMPVLAMAMNFDVIVNAGVTEAKLTKDQIRQILLANRTTWSDGTKITIIALSPEAPGADEVANEYMNMSAVQAKKHWLTKVFAGILVTAPPLGDSAEDVAEKIGVTAGSIAIVPQGTKLGKAKILPQG